MNGTEDNKETGSVLVVTRELLPSDPALYQKQETEVDWDDIIPKLKAMGTDIIFPGRRGDGTPRRF